MRSSATALVCALFPVLATGSRGGTPPGAPSGETPSSAEEVPPPPPSAHTTRVFECIDRIEITGGSSGLKVASNALVVVRTERDTVTVELRPGSGRSRSEPQDPAPGKITIVSGGAGGANEWKVPALRVVFRFSPWEKGSVSVTGIGDLALMEACAILGQGPVSHVLKPRASAEYAISIESGGAPFTMKGQQRTGELWVDWLLRGRGILEVGSGGWLMPMHFVLPVQEVGRKDVTMAAEASMRYSSMRPGPEDETELATTLTYTGRGEQLRYKRECVLKPITLELKDLELPTGNLPPAAAGLGRKAALWARTATLATLGVQRLAGVRETGLGMWVAQVGIDSLAGREVPRVASRESRERIESVARLSPELRPMPGSAEAQIGWKNLIRAEAGLSLVNLTAEADGEEDTGIGIVPDLSISVRRKVGEGWRFGAGLDVMSLDTNTKTPEGSWADFSILARVERVSPSTSLGVSAGYSFVGYEMSSSARTARADLRAPMIVVEWEWSSRRSFGLGFKGHYAGDGRLKVLRVQPGIRWHFGRNVALQAQVVWLQVSDADAFGGEVAAGGLGGGAGIVVRW